MSSKFEWNYEKHKHLASIATNKLMRSGISCCFFPLSKTVGVKLYYNEKVRNHASELQKLAYEHGLAPNSGSPFDFKCLCFHRDDDCEFTVGRQTLYGYLTQLATRKKGQLSWEKEFELKCRLWCVGIDHCDLSNSNVGYIGDRLVCIDFDMFSCQKVRGRKPHARRSYQAAKRRQIQRRSVDVQPDYDGGT